MSDTTPPDNAVAPESIDKLLTEIPAQLIANNNEGSYITHAITNIAASYKDKLRAILSTFFRFYKVFLANDIDKIFLQELHTSHKEILLLLLKTFKTITDGMKISIEDMLEIQKLLDNIKENDISYFNAFTSIEVYKLMKSAQNKFIEEQRVLQQEREAIVNRFEDVYLKSGLSSYSKDFSKLCASETTAKKWWLGAMVAGSVAFLVYFFINIRILQQASDLTLTKLIIYIPVTVLAFLILTWLGRRYATCREQEITYQHLATILSTYKSFQENLDDTNKGLLILETARVVTTIPKPLTKESPSFDYSKVIDIIKILDKNK